jgi:aminobenzoyl-glutamate utilization protein B
VNQPPVRLLLLGLSLSTGLAARAPSDGVRLEALKQEALGVVDAESTLVQRIVDQFFSYGELGFQETETSHHRGPPAP